MVRATAVRVPMAWNWVWVENGCLDVNFWGGKMVGG